ncbi:uncharacterized protein [Apostichopus japonicus]|uniref:uncharacterized protein isoform X2 n=1 Tax=Stichopus japonicus TaxID=307972 RepID=UPI003AB7DFF6
MVLQACWILFAVLAILIEGAECYIFQDVGITLGAVISVIALTSCFIQPPSSTSTPGANVSDENPSPTAPTLAVVSHNAAVNPPSQLPMNTAALTPSASPQPHLGPTSDGGPSPYINHALDLPPSYEEAMKCASSPWPQGS